MLASKRRVLASCFLSLALAAPSVRAEVYSYVDWTSADVAGGTATGTITLPDDSTVEVTFEAINSDGSSGTLHGAQTEGGTDFWSPDDPYISEEVENAPPTPDILQLSGGVDQTYKVTLSEPIKDPLMAIVSLGQPSLVCTYQFDSPFTIVSQGKGYWGGTDTSLTELDGNVLQGYEGHGTIRFLGTFDTFSWTVPTPETWHGFTFAIRTTEALEPTPGAGGAGGAGGDSGSGSSGDGGSDSASGAPNDPGGAGGTAGKSGGSAGSSANEGGGPDSGAAGGEAPAGGQATLDYSQTKTEAGCNCALTPGTLGASALAPGLLLLSLVARRRKR